MIMMGGTVCYGRDKVSFCPQYLPQAQFAGYYVAYEKNYYANEGLDVTIVHPNPASGELPIDMMLAGKVDIAGTQLYQAILKAGNGQPMVNILQLFQTTGLCIVTKEPIQSAIDLDGKKVARWSMGYAEICDMIEAANNIKIDWIPTSNPINLYAYDAADAILVYSYNELLQIKQIFGDLDDQNIHRFSDIPNMDIPEDGLYVTKKYYESHREIAEKFARASKRGWEYAKAHPEDALEITLKVMREHKSLSNIIRESEMLEEVLRLQEGPVTAQQDFAPLPKEKWDKLLEQMVGNGVIKNKVEYYDFIKR